MAVAVALAAVQTGPYLSAWAALPVVVVLLAWAKLLSWADKDAPDARLPRLAINSGNWAGLVLAVALLLFLPLGFWGGFAVFFLVFVAEIGIYLAVRNKKVGLGDLRTRFDAWLKGLTHKEKPVEAVAGQVQVIDKSGTPLPPPMSDSPERAPYDAAQALLTDPLRRSADRIDLIPSAEGAAVSYLVDGVRYAGSAMDRGSAAAAVTYLKTAAGLDVAERRKPQKGGFKTALDGVRREVQAVTKGNSVGESLSLVVDAKKRHGFTPDTLGFTPEQLKAVKDAVANSSGVVLLAAPPGQGLTALEYGLLRGHDAFVQHLQTMERNQEQDLEGVTQNPLPAGASAADEAKQASWLMSQQPDVVLMDTVGDVAAVRELVNFAGEENKRAYFGLRAGNTFEALRQWRKLMADDALAMKNLRLIVAGRTIRKLCSACKIAYNPDPNLLKKLNMDPAKVTVLYQARTTPMRDAKGNVVPCTFCNDLGFKGRTGIFEVFVIDDAVRQVVKSNGSDNEMKAVFRKQKGRYLQEMALALVEKGETSVNEVQRVLRPPDEGKK